MSIKWNKKLLKPLKNVRLDSVSLLSGGGVGISFTVMKKKFKIREDLEPQMHMEVGKALTNRRNCDMLDADEYVLIPLRTGLRKIKPKC